MFQLLEKIDKALESKGNCTLIDKMGKYFHGQVKESWIRMSGGKLRGKLQFMSEERGEFEMDAHDILDLIVENKS